jgi:predicted TIM-barrel fold metal-dependent hydrolase
MIVDAHCHIGETPHYKQTAEDLLREMDANGVGRSAICASGRHITVDNEEGNRLVAEAVRKYHGRFYGFAAVNPWYGEKAIIELRRAVDDGLVGLKLHPSMQGYHAHDPLADPVVAAATELDLPIYIHSGTPVFSLPLQIVELAQRHPEAKIIMGHMGGADFYVDVPSSAHFATNVFYETSLTCHVGYVDEIIARAGHERILFGSDSPTSQQSAELLKIRLSKLTDEERADVLGGNFLRLLPTHARGGG